MRLTNKIAAQSETPDVLSLECLLTRSVAAIQQGKFDEGLVLLSLVYAQVASDQAGCTDALDTFRAEYSNYRQAQYALQEASVRFARVCAGLQDKVADLTLVMSELLHSTNTCSQTVCVERQHNTVSQNAQSDTQEALVSLTPSTGPLVQHESDSLPALFIICLAPFEVKVQDAVLPLCSSSSARRILRYLVAQSGHRASADMLQTLLWPEDEAEVAQRKLHSAISTLRRTFDQGQSRPPAEGYFIYKHRSYALNPLATIHTDVDEFLRLYQQGKREHEQQISYYEQACTLYTRPFLLEDVYEDWSSLQREQLSRMYVTMCQVLTEHYLAHQCYDEAAKWATAILNQNRCDETAHRHLMQIYACQGRRSEALQQYQRCKRILSEELSVQPLPETTYLFQTLQTEGAILSGTEKM